jgi:hypothetical protein
MANELHSRMNELRKNVKTTECVCGPYGGPKRGSGSFRGKQTKNVLLRVTLIKQEIVKQGSEI